MRAPYHLPEKAPKPAVAQTAEPLLVRLGIRYFQSLSKQSQRSQAPIDAVHLLNPDERKALRRIERGAIFRAALAGALSTLVAAAVEVIWANPLLGPRPRFATWADQARFYAVVAVATIITSALEILYLYWDGLRAVHRLSHEAGLDLFPDQDDDRAVASAMARAALELPNPNSQLFGVNPRREASRVRLFIASIVYKLKVSITNFLIKALVRRMLGRAFVRSWLPFVAVPFTAAWNAFICFLIMREARIRAMGPSAAKEMIDIVFDHANKDSVSAPTKTLALRAVASSIVRTEDLHPNLAALLHEVAKHVGMDESKAAADRDGALDDTSLFLKGLATLAPNEQSMVLRVLAVASIIDGRLTKAEKRLLLEAQEICKRPPNLDPVERLRKAFIDGDPIDPKFLIDLAS